ncbi:lysine-specific demethylase JMJ21 isoform X2 [Phragmites australis]|uniref:lysine-specific demethylase JMJ21 isoform X2 n=1 Tax=Phragmites australis TaxID=29695 RepID=UPI002D78E0B2|nr:lysine-specific demethylase JMJ21 isoform X2 [Phragmites australis]
MEAAGDGRREAALGGLAVLPDEVLCAVVDLLPPADIGRLACVSSVMYILCNEEPLWMSKCLSIGGLLEYKGSWKKTTLCRLGLCSENDEAYQKPRHFDGFNSFYLYRRWYRCFTTLSSFSFDDGHVERKDDLLLDQFRSQYDGKGPVLLTKLAETWPARTKWTMQQLTKDYGEVPFRISQRSPQKITMKLKDYLSYMELQHDEDPLYIFDDKFGESAPALLEDYSVPHLFQEDFFDILDYEQRPAFRWLIIGPERSGASWHVDPGLTSAWNTLLCGRKRWALYPPGRVPGGVTVHVSDEDGDVDIETPTSLQWWLDIYPNLAENEKPLECTQLSGETIFVPSGWWHCVLNLETTVAVTQNFVNQSNFQHACLDMAPGHSHKGVCRAGLLAVPGTSVKDNEHHPPGTVSRWHHPDISRKEKRLKGSEPLRTLNSENQCSSFEFSGVQGSLENQAFSYDIDFLSQFLEKERDHYSSVWSPTNSIGQREAREWLRRLWVLRRDLRELIWKGACLAISVDKWYSCLQEICLCHSLPLPTEDEKLPVGTGSNPVFIVSGNVIKIYAEGGLGYSVHGLGTELEFYDLLRKVDSPLINHIPEIIASGFLEYKDAIYRTVPWDGKGIPDVLAKHYPLEASYANSCFPLGLWSKQRFGMSSSSDVSNRPIWPYMVTRKCKGDIFARIHDTLSKTDILLLASSLGVQMRNIHLLPLPHMDVPKSGDNNVKEMAGPVCDDDMILPEWKQLVSTLNGRKKNVKKHLANWGNSVPQVLIEKAEEYLPPNMGFFIKFDKILWTITFSSRGSQIWVLPVTSKKFAKEIWKKLMQFTLLISVICPSGILYAT